MNPDLRQAGINNRAMAVQHFRMHGQREGRVHRLIHRTLKIVLMTKNERYLIKHWIQYHGERFGYANLHVIDDSDDPVVLEYYESVKPLGVHFYFFRSSLRTLENNINTVLTRIRNQCDFMTKMDTDEFLGCYNPETKEISIDGETIGRELDGLVVDGLKYKASYSMNVLPEPQHLYPTSNVTFTEPFKTTFKTIFSSRTYQHCDLGCHVGQVRSPHDSSRHHDTNLIVVHYHHQRYEQYIENARKAIVSHGFINVTDSQEVMINKLTALKKNPGGSCHKVIIYDAHLRDPVGQRAMYYKQFAQFPRYQFTKIYALFANP